MYCYERAHQGGVSAHAREFEALCLIWCQAEGYSITFYLS